MSGLEIDVSAQLVAALNRNSDELQRQREYQWKRQGAVQLVPIVSPQVSGSGAIDQADNLKCKTGYYWDIKRLTCFGFSAGTVTVYRNGTATVPGEPVAPFLTNGAVFTYGTGQLMLHPDDRLIIVGTGITGTFQLIGEAVCFEQWYLAEYLD